MPNQRYQPPNKADDMPVPGRPIQATSSTVPFISLAAGNAQPAAPHHQPTSATPATPASLIASAASLRIHTPDCGVSDRKSGELNQEQCTCGIAASPDSSYPISIRAAGSSPTHLQPAVRTRRQAKGSFDFQVLSGSEWEAVDIAKARKVEEEKAEAKKAEARKGKGKRAKARHGPLLNCEREERSMSRNRPRGPPTRDNGVAANEEIEMWNRIRQDIFKAAEKNEKQKGPGQQLAALREKIAKAGRSEYIAYFFPFCPVFQRCAVRILAIVIRLSLYYLHLSLAQNGSPVISLLAIPLTTPLFLDQSFVLPLSCSKNECYLGSKQGA